ncbi:MAG: hypothetical protein PHO66_02195 [Eubacteriales bacterium]|nr:hypothetical protein [Eubacteriales bacterium]
MGGRGRLCKYSVRGTIWAEQSIGSLWKFRWATAMAATQTGGARMQNVQRAKKRCVNAAHSGNKARRWTGQSIGSL